MRLFVILCLFIMVSPVYAESQQSDSKTAQPSKAVANPPRLTRAQSFLGIHFDFHANDKDLLIGENVTPEMVENIIAKVKPDYIQVDSKGHPGYSSFLTDVGVRAGGFVGDPLCIWREITARHGVALYMHHSGVFDMQAVLGHPDWACIDKDGKPDKQYTSVFGPYVDQRLIPQLKELRKKYGVDGAWVDGDCWAVQLDYRPEVLKLFQEKTGIEAAPGTVAESNLPVLAEISREGFRKYLRHYVDQLHAFDPNFQIASNWAFTSFMPEPVTANVDFISGDFSPLDSVNTARVEARCMRLQGKPWDLMAWSFRWRGVNEPSTSTKSAVQLKQEAAEVLALGGGFQVYFPQKRDGSVSDWQMNVMADVAKFCRERQKICHRAQPVPQVALVCSTTQIYKLSARPFGFGYYLSPLAGILRCLMDGQNSVDILMEHQLKGHTRDYPLIIVPEWKYLDDGLCRELVDYAKDGGSLLLIGPDSAALFKEHLGVTFKDDSPATANWLEHNGILTWISSSMRPIKLKEDVEAVGRIFPENDLKKPSEIAATVRSFGKGKIAAVYVNLGERYVKNKNIVTRDFVNDLVRRMFNPLVDVKGSHDVDVIVNKQGEKLAINLVNTAGPHSDMSIETFDEIPSIGPLELTIRSEKRPRNITLEPSHVRLKFEYKNGIAKVVIPRVEIHDIVVLD